MTTSPSLPQPAHCTCTAASGTGGLSSDIQDWLTPDEVVGLLRGAITLGTLRNYRSARTGPAYVKLGRAIFYPRAEVDAWLEEQVRLSDDRWNDRY